jgi:hypothetical protein
MTDSETLVEGTVWIGGGGGEGGCKRSEPPRPASYLEQFGKRVTGEKREWVEAQACGCRSRFCPHCCLALGIKLKQRLRPELAKFTGLMMLTFTIDPELFTSPREAYEYIRRHRCISVTMQRLDRWRLLHSRRYICVIEWQKNGWPHWHVLVDASHIPFAQLCEAWNRNHPLWKERVAMGRPGLGSVKFSAPKLERDRAAGYVTAYLTKHPEHGYPEWIGDMPVGSVRRFEASRGFWSKSEDLADEPSDERDEDVEDDDDDCDDAAEGEDKQDRRTVAEQLASCGMSCVVLHVREVVDEQTGELVTVRDFVALLRVPLSEFLTLVPPDAVSPRRTVALYLDVGWAVRSARRWVAGLTVAGSAGSMEHSDMEVT